MSMEQQENSSRFAPQNGPGTGQLKDGIAGVSRRSEANPVSVEKRKPCGHGMIRVIKNISGTNSSIRVHFLSPVPPVPKDGPLLFYIHGGGWVARFPLNALSCRLAENMRMEVWAIEYSLSPAAAPGIALDEIETVWKRINHSRKRIIIGDSAGGNLAASFVSRATIKPDGLILLWPVIDISGKHYESYDLFRFEKKMI
jgi:acetyl esterase/lipase